MSRGNGCRRLRYRLAATPVLAQRWPDGFERLASPKQAVRHQAVKDLEQLVTGNDEKLLLELFASPDPFVREISLRVLHRSSTDVASGAMLKLLYDPDANVRSAVLKQMLDAPSAEWTKKMIDYICWEKETDLTVAAVRVLREIGTDAAGEALMAIFDNPAWQVRAEAVEGLVKLRPGHGEFPEKLQARVEQKLGKLLEDPDSFVAGKSLGLISSQGRSEREAASRPGRAASGADDGGRRLAGAIGAAERERPQRQGQARHGPVLGRRGSSSTVRRKTCGRRRSADCSASHIPRGRVTPRSSPASTRRSRSPCAIPPSRSASRSCGPSISIAAISIRKTMPPSPAFAAATTGPSG